MVLTINSEIVEPQFDTVPEEMRALDNWVVWQTQPTKKVTDDGEPVLDKVLKRTNGAAASSTDASTWSSFHDAYQSYINGEFDGIGFVFEPENKIIGLDMDGHFNDGEPLTEFAETICSTTYVEVSPSGTGAHAYFIGELPEQIKHKYKDTKNNTELELYNGGRYFTFTGEMVGTQEISDNQRTIDDLVKFYFKKDDVETEIEIHDARTPFVLPTQDVKKRMLKNDKISRLFNGDISDYGNDDSSADMALANYLAFWTSKHYKQMDDIFRESGLMRDKWDEKRGDDTYGERTLKKAIAECRDVYKHSTTNTQETDDHVWDDLVNFEYDEVLPFPKNVFPQWLESYIDQVAQSTQTPREMAAMGAFTALSIATAKKFNVNVYGDWKEPMNTYLLTLMPPSSKKSQVFNNMMKPITDYQKDDREYMRPKIRDSQDDIEIKEKRIAALKKRMSEPKKGDSLKETEENLKFAKDDLEDTEELTEPTYFADDVTSEVLEKLLQENNEKLGIISAEGGLFSNIQGRYSDATNYDVYLKGHPADRLSAHRLTRDAVELDAPHLTVGVFAQPSVIQDIPRALFDKGLMARFLYSLPTDNRGERQIRPQQIDEQTANEYYQNIKSLMRINEDDVSLKMSRAADLKVQLLQEEIEHRQSEGEDLRENEDIESWAGKLAGQLMRLAGLIHMSEILTDKDYEIKESTIESIEKLKEYFITHMKKAFNVSNSDERTQSAKYLMQRMLDKHEEGTLKRQKLWQQVKRKFNTAKELDSTLQLLEDRSYIKVVEFKTDDRGGRPFKIIVINPTLL